LNTSRASRYTRRDQIREKHRREMKRQVYLPLIIAGLILGAATIAMLIFFSPYQLGTAASFMSLLLLVPTALVCVVPYILLIVMALAFRKLNAALPSKFRSTRTIIHRANTGSQSLSRKIAGPIIWINSRIAWLEHMVSERRPRKALPPTTTERR
jgi:hypothetical protein